MKKLNFTIMLVFAFIYSQAQISRNCEEISGYVNARDYLQNKADIYLSESIIGQSEYLYWHHSDFYEVQWVEPILGDLNTCFTFSDLNDDWDWLATHIEQSRPSGGCWHGDPYTMDIEIDVVSPLPGLWMIRAYVEYGCLWPQ